MNDSFSLAEESRLFDPIPEVCIPDFPKRTTSGFFPAGVSPGQLECGILDNLENYDFYDEGEIFAGPAFPSLHLHATIPYTNQNGGVGPPEESFFVPNLNEEDVLASIYGELFAEQMSPRTGEQQVYRGPLTSNNTLSTAETFSERPEPCAVSTEG